MADDFTLRKSNDAGAEEVEVEAEEAHETTFLRKGASVVYESNKPEIAVIVGVHHDDDETYYTIRLSDGREKQTGCSSS